ncbi:lipopolysaccharide kinase InaA family protein [uncultured Lamprocystis sp.]|uniref:helix-hairpin-helix domain-containing protein n=1 Tax=uncultured Lamprocystis sp. TaxID=543132 RepID=UPI0025F768AC|nr:lipopolysaccharide kinase InaA family protein [uncultured Lamprocystis sp.]
MANIVKLKALDGRTVEFVDTIIGQGAMKDVYCSPDKSYVVAFFRTKQNAQSRDRLSNIVGTYREKLFNQQGGDYWKNLFCWPDSIVEWNGLLGIVMPAYQGHYFFQHGSKNGDNFGIKGNEKEGKWFASAKNRSRYLDPRELGSWQSYLTIGIKIARAVKRLHAAGLAHSDLSYKNVLVDPVGSNACIIDIDTLVVPQRYPPDVVGTPDFIAPEVVMTNHLNKEDPKRHLPSIATDRHALSVLIYMYLLYRHPLRGDKVHDVSDTQRDETLSMGERALFVEHPTDDSNRIRVKHLEASELPWKDTKKVPYTITGPYLVPLFNRAFIEGLHDPAKRPSADEWEQALVKTVDLLQPCQNADCEQKWYVFDNSIAPKCPFCGTSYQGRLPVLNLYSARKQGSYIPDNHRLMVYTNQSLFPWHINRNIFPNERLAPKDQKRGGYFVFHKDSWWLVNERMPDLADMTAGSPIKCPPGGKVELKDNQKLLLSKEEGGRVVVVQMVAGASGQPSLIGNIQSGLQKMLHRT